MNANELMLGDWVLIEEHEEPAYILELERDKVWIQGKYQYPFIPYDKISPIPLTAEILEKNGFVRGGIIPSKFYRYTDNEQIMFCPYSGCYDIEYVHWNELNEADVTHRLDVQHPLKYVHELQHALRLCGLTELADNFKVE